MTSRLEGFQAPRLDEPLVVLTYAYSGVVRLRTLLEEWPGMAWIGTDLVKSCGQLAADWQQVEGHNGAMSRLARTSITTLFGTMLTTRLIGKGALRYCIPADSSHEAVERFALLYPKARFLCLHRTLLDVIYSAVTASPWGMGGGPCTQFALTYPGNTVAAFAAYWAQQSSRILAFEHAHPERALRIRYEDLDADSGETARRIEAFADLPHSPGQRPATGGPAYPSSVGNGSVAGPAPVGCGAQVPVERIPSAMLAQVNELLGTLGYATLTAQ